jgi:hypothetical protein
MALDLHTDAAASYRASHSEEDKPDQPREQSEREKAIVLEALERFAIVQSAESKQRARELEDLKFDRALPEDQWPTEIMKARQGGVGPDGKVTAARPCLTINRLGQPVQTVTNEARQARLGIEVKPKGNGANDETAEVLQGMIRTIEVDSRAPVGRIWALERAAKCGRGAYRVLTEYANDGDHDLDIVIKRIKNQGTVYLDPYASEPDWSDGEWCIITEDIPKKQFKREFKHSKIAAMLDDVIAATELQSITDRAPGWVDGDTVRIAEYFYLEHESKTLVDLPEPLITEKGPTKFLEDFPPDAAELIKAQIARGEIDSRPVDIRKVKWCKITATEVLEEQEWPGRYIPVVPVIGREFNVDGEACYKGIISDSKDAQRSYNVMRSGQVEAVGLNTRAPWVVAEGQLEGYQAMWDQANTKNYSALVYKPTSHEGNLLPPPQRNTAEPAIQAISQAVREAEADIKATTGIFDPSLGNLTSRERSGKAIESLKEQGQLGTSNYLENLAMLSMHYEAKILLDLIPKIYHRKGRIVRLLGDDPADERQVMLNQPFTEQGGQLQPAPTQPPGMLGKMGAAIGGMMGRPAPPPPKHYDLAKGDYGVVVSVGRSFQRQRDANQATYQAVMEAVPEAAVNMLDLVFEEMDGPAAKKLAKRFKKLIPAAAEDGTEGLPPEAQAQIAQLQQQLQEAQAVAQQLQQEAAIETAKIQGQQQTEQIKLQGQQQTEAVKLQAESQIEAQKLASERELAAIKLEAETRMAEQKLQAEIQMNREKLAAQERLELQKLEMQLMAQREMAALKASADAQQQDNQQAHERGMQAQGTADTMAQTEQQAAHTHAQGEQQAFHAHTQAEQAAKHAKEQAKLRPNGKSE